MNSRERVLTALNHEEPDRVPIDIPYTPEAADKLVTYLSREKQIEAGPDDIPLVMNHDILAASHGIGSSYYAREEEEYICEWGITWKWITLPTGGRYTEMVGHPLADESKLSSYSCPNPAKTTRYDRMRELITEYGATHAICGGMGSTLFEPAWHLRGFETFLMDLVANKDFAHELLDKVFDFQLETGKILADIGADLLKLGDDHGTQSSLMMSVGTFREFFKHRYARLFSAYKEVKPDIKIAFHSDGNIEPLLPDLIETGVDIFQAVQPLSIDPGKIKKLYGDRLSFWGTVDIQEVMPFGTPADVEKEIRLRIETVGKGGGLILAPSHAIQPDVPLENILSFYSAAEKYGYYPV
ncbi:MAG: hypothetical protein JXB48_01945 [Candidatus Latescibacteria bacterium]|nr:hypothetical protein [Candidatus Latescibacterota bacterium]